MTTIRVSVISLRPNVVYTPMRRYWRNRDTRQSHHRSKRPIRCMTAGAGGDSVRPSSALTVWYCTRRFYRSVRTQRWFDLYAAANLGGERSAEHKLAGTMLSRVSKRGRSAMIRPFLLDAASTRPLRIRNQLRSSTFHVLEKGVNDVLDLLRHVGVPMPKSM